MHIESQLMRLFILVMMASCLYGCALQRQHDIDAQTTRACIAVCQTQMSQCATSCTHHCRACEKEAVRETKKGYQRYLKERCVKGKSFVRRLQSYHDPLQCRKTTCDCAADLRVCVESCRGDIHKQIQVEKSCC